MEALDSIISLNETAEFIRTKAGLGLDAIAISKSLADEFEIDQESATADVIAVLAELEQIGAIKPGAPK
jgi:hypothetical protein